MELLDALRVAGNAKDTDRDFVNYIWDMGQLSNVLQPDELSSVERYGFAVDYLEPLAPQAESGESEESAESEAT